MQLIDQEIDFREEGARQINLTISYFLFHKKDIWKNHPRCLC